jgi:hypothetical protein
MQEMPGHRCRAAVVKLRHRKRRVHKRSPFLPLEPLLMPKCGFPSAAVNRPVVSHAISALEAYRRASGDRRPHSLPPDPCVPATRKAQGETNKRRDVAGLRDAFARRLNVGKTRESRAKVKERAFVRAPTHSQVSCFPCLPEMMPVAVRSSWVARNRGQASNAEH